ncbi:MAG: DUF2863 family protein [Betaproteobacteria bacterium]|nr:DUF2863 family protein [Betaproteobacteria bacterium]
MWWSTKARCGNAFSFQHHSLPGRDSALLPGVCPQQMRQPYRRIGRLTALQTMYAFAWCPGFTRLINCRAILPNFLLRWQDIEASDHATRVQCLEQWVAQGRPNLEPVMVGCGFECLLPDAFHINLRESDRRVRPYALRAAVHYLTHALSIEAKQLRANIAAFGQDRLDEYRIGLSFAESEADDPNPLDQIKQQLLELGVSDIRVHPGCSEPEFCDDCGSPLYPNGDGEVVHAEMPEDSEPNPGHFH